MRVRLTETVNPECVDLEESLNQQNVSGGVVPNPVWMRGGRTIANTLSRQRVGSIIRNVCGVVARRMAKMLGGRTIANMPIHQRGALSKQLVQWVVVKAMGI